MITFGALYFLTPRLWNRERLYSLQLVSWHFWLATIGIVLYASSMWVTGIMEGLMWREVDANGFLVNAFADTVAAKFPMYVVRALGGGLFLTGALIMCYNLWMTVTSRGRAGSSPRAPWSGRIRGRTWHFLTSTRPSKPTPRCCWCSASWSSPSAGSCRSCRSSTCENTIEKVEGMRPYTPLELAGRDIYIREGCYVCHSQMIRPMRDEVERYGHYSLAAESHVRPSVPVGVQAHRAGPGPRRAAAIRTNGMSTT